MFGRVLKPTIYIYTDMHISLSFFCLFGLRFFSALSLYFVTTGRPERDYPQS